MGETGGRGGKGVGVLEVGRIAARRRLDEEVSTLAEDEGEKEEARGANSI